MAMALKFIITMNVTLTFFILLSSWPVTRIGASKAPSKDLRTGESLTIPEQIFQKV